MRDEDFVLQMELNVLETQILKDDKTIDIEKSLKKINELEAVNPFLIRRRDVLNHFLKKINYGV
tara:strand:+ start:406 stop:597 length:192 start_codon:yes stop_codon:yes gene_type:complete